MRSLRAKNVGRPVRYYVPEWDDRVYSSYQLSKDRRPGTHGYHDKVYAHEIYEQPTYDGLLISRATALVGREKRAMIAEHGVHAYARFSPPILGDCGAFSYIAAPHPPYATKDMLEYYQRSGFDYAVSIDHLIVPAFAQLSEERYRITRNNAREFLEEYKSGDYTFHPIGVAQGWSPESYRYAVAELLDWGYQYIALGGLARTPTPKILEILQAVAPLLHEDTDLHLFGVARLHAISDFIRFGVTSFDSASPLRQAWLSASRNYHTLDGKRYSAFRIVPVSDTHPKVKRLRAQGIPMAWLQQVEQQALGALREYDHGQLSIEKTLEALMALDIFDPEGAAQQLPLYKATLIDQPWKQCPCQICRELGIDVVMFRGNERNRRRGFHNTYVFYQQLQGVLKGETKPFPLQASVPSSKESQVGDLRP